MLKTWGSADERVRVVTSEKRECVVVTREERERERERGGALA